MVSVPLKSLSIGQNKLGDEGVSVLCEALKTNTTLENLDITADLFGSDKIGPSGAKIIAEMLVVNTSLTSLDLRINGLDDASKAMIRTACEAKGFRPEL